MEGTERFLAAKFGQHTYLGYGGYGIPIIMHFKFTVLFLSRLTPP